MSQPYFTTAELMTIQEVLVKEGLATKRDFLLADLPPLYAAKLPVNPAPADQVLSDLLQMNRRPFLEGGVVPIVDYLTAALAHAQTPPNRELLQARANEALAKYAKAHGSARGSTGRPEQIIHRNDMVPFGFFAAGTAAGASVARVTVTRVLGGVPSTIGVGGPVRSLGTAWLIGRKHAVTAFHVVQSRHQGEPAIAEADLAAQVEGAVLEFDVHEAHDAGRAVKVRALRAWAPSDGLDYAVLELAEDPGAAPLAVSNEVPKEDTPVNIIQHPGGAPKRLGIRNNLLRTVTDEKVEYFTDTLEGSSGAPVLTDDWKVVAVHQEYNAVTNVTFQGKETSFVNVGVRMDRILADIERQAPDVRRDIKRSRS